LFREILSTIAPNLGKFLEILWKVIQEAKKQDFGALRSFASKGRQRPTISLGTTVCIQLRNFGISDVKL
jgi:hypothetical protein